MNRREFIKVIAGSVVAAEPLGAFAQTPPKQLRIGVVAGISRGLWDPIELGLRELGYVDGQNFTIEFINLEGQIGRYPEAMKELVQRKVDILVAAGPEIALKSALGATDTLPIVMVALDYDPLALGYVTSLAKPASNVTGLFLQQIEQAAKRVQLMKEAFPQLQAATVFWDRISADQWQAARSAGETFGFRLAGIELRDTPYDYDGAWANVPPDHRSALMVSLSPLFFSDRQRIADFALRHRVASMFAVREFVDAGGLLSFGVSFATIGRRTAAYLDRIAKGAKPADLPIEQPTKFDLVVNLKTAKAIGVEIPQSILLRADAVID
jgi:putative ABC transport system substrate-binding protein